MDMRLKFVYHLFILILVIVCIEAHYNVSVSVRSFNNPTSKCATCSNTTTGTPIDSLPAISINRLGCCDNHDNTGFCSGDEVCDPGFYFCLLPLNGTSFRDCVTGIGASRTARFYQSNSTSVTVSSSSNQFSGLDVPFVLSGISNEWTGVQLYIWACDADNIFPNGTNFKRDDDTIDQFYINITSRIGISTARRVYTGIHGLATIDVSFRITCAQYYYGDACENLNECELNAVTCNGRGQCEDGVDSYICNCNPRYAGDQCEDLNDCFINSIDCNGNGQCVDGVGTYTCECDSGYTGVLCDQKQASIAAIAGGTTGGIVVLVVIIAAIVCSGVLICRWWNKVPKTTTATRPTVTTTTAASANTRGTSDEVTITTISSHGPTAPPPNQPPPPYPTQYPPQNYPAHNYYYPPQQHGGQQMYPGPQYKGPEMVEMNKYPGAVY